MSVELDRHLRNLELEKQSRGQEDEKDARIAALEKALAELLGELEKWGAYYGADDPRDGVVNTAVGRIVGEQNQEIHELRRQIEKESK